MAFLAAAIPAIASALGGAAGSTAGAVGTVASALGRAASSAAKTAGSGGPTSAPARQFQDVSQVFRTEPSTAPLSDQGQSQLLGNLRKRDASVDMPASIFVNQSGGGGGGGGVIAELLKRLGMGA